MRSRSGFTIVELLVLLGVAAFVWLMAGVLSARKNAMASMVSREATLNAVAQAISVYKNCNNDYYPFSSGPAYDAAHTKDSMTSLGVLYPNYLGSAVHFQGSGETETPYFYINVPREILEDVDDLNRNGMIDPSEVAGLECAPLYYRYRNFTLIGSDYGYDCRISPGITGQHAVLGALTPEVAAGRAGTMTAFRNILYADGHIAPRDTNYVSNDPNDNIFTEDSPQADIDSYLSNNVDPVCPWKGARGDLDLKLADMK